MFWWKELFRFSVHPLPCISWVTIPLKAYKAREKLAGTFIQMFNGISLTLHSCKSNPIQAFTFSRRRRCVDARRSGSARRESRLRCIGWPTGTPQHSQSRFSHADRQSITSSSDRISAKFADLFQGGGYNRDWHPSQPRNAESREGQSRRREFAEK